VTKGLSIAPAEGKVGLLLVGLGAVSTTTIAGILAVRKGIAKPIGSLTEMGTVRLGKRTDARSPSIREFVPLAELNSLVFGGWDIFEDNCYEAATTAGGSTLANFSLPSNTREATTLPSLSTMKSARSEIPSFAR